MTPISNRPRVADLLARMAARYRWLHAPAGLLVLLLQRTPVLRVAAQAEFVTNTGVGDAVRSIFALGALGALNSLAGASGTTTTTTTVTSTGTTTTTTTISPLSFAVTDGNPAVGPAGTTFSIAENLGTAVNLSFTLTGGVTNPKSWNVSGNLPDGLSVVGGNPVNVGVPYKLAIAGTPTATGVWSVTVTAYNGADETGTYNSITCVFAIAQNAVLAPTITTQPADANGVVGGSVTFTATANGSPAPTVKWYHGSQLLAGQTTQVLTLANLQSSDAGAYTMTATNAAGTTTTVAATLTVSASAIAPGVTSQPQGLTVTERTPVTFTVTASGTAALTYQWNKDGTAITGATTSNYGIPLAQTSDAGNYTVTITNSAGSVTSSPATLIVNAIQVAPKIVAQPQSATVTEGSAVKFAVTASGTAPLAYQWSKDGTPLTGATTSSYSIALAHASDAGNYAVAVTNNNGTVTSNAAALTLNAAQVTPVISTQPQNATAAPGSSASFSVVAVGSNPLAYQWMFNSTAIAGATNATYTNSSVQSSDAGIYTVVVSNNFGSVTSQAVNLVVSSSASSAPVITVQPSSDTVASGHSVSFAAAVSGNTAASYQWQISTDGGTTWTALADSSTYAGTNSATLTVSNVTSAMSGYHYRLLASNAAGSTSTSIQTLTVAAPAFPGPFGMAVDASGNLFVSDTSNNTIQFVTPTGSVGLLAGSSGQQGSADGSYGSALFRQPRGLALDKSENLYVADTGNSLIRKISPAGVVTTLAGSASVQGYIDATSSAAAFNSPQALAVDGSGNVYVADTGNSAIRRITPAGVVTTIAGSGFKGSADGTANLAAFNQPSGIVLDSAGNLYVCDTFNDTVRKITPDGVVTTLAGVAGVGGYADGPMATALFNFPTGIAIDGSGNLFVADTGNEIIRVIKTDGTVISLAGLPTIAGLLDGTGSQAWFNQPEHLGLDSSANLYVTDNGNAAIRKVTSAGVVTTLVLQQTTSAPSVPAPAATSSSTSSSSGSASGGTSTSNSGGGGAMEPEFVIVLLGLAALHRRRRSRILLRP